MDTKAALSDNEKIILENIKLEHEEPTICYITADGKTNVSETAITEEDISLNTPIYESNSRIDEPILELDIKIEEPTFASEVKTEKAQIQYENVTIHHQQLKHSGDWRQDKEDQSHSERYKVEERFECFECKRVFNQLFLLKEHCLIHTNGKPFVCDYNECSKSFRTILYLKRHQQKHNIEKQSRLKKHWKTHSDEKQYSCEICLKKYKLYTSLKLHLQGHDERTCQICAIEFNTIFRLKVHHRKNHSGEKPFSCDFCSKCFLRKSTLLNHRLIHTDERPFHCPDCTAKFRKLVNLKTHILRHSNDRPHSCTVCDKKFKTKCDLQTHIKNHSEERPHVCHTCPMRFKSKSDLNRHIRIHTGEKRFECNECSKKFAYNDSLNKHKKKDHNLKREGIESTEKKEEMQTQCTPISRYGEGKSLDEIHATSQPIETDIFIITEVKTEIDSETE